MKIITIAVQKGGTGKTTTAAALAQGAAKKGLDVLAIDLDPQGNLSYCLAAAPEGRGSLGLIEGDPPEKLIRRTSQGVYVIPAAWGLSTLGSFRGSARRLQKALGPIKEKFDLILIDTPPTLGEMQYNALQASSGLIIPLLADIYGLQAFYQVAETARKFQATNEDFEILGVILTQFDKRSTIARQMFETIRIRSGELGVPFLGAVRNSVAVREAAALQRSLFDYAPKSNPAADYMQILDKILKE